MLAVLIISYPDGVGIITCWIAHARRSMPSARLVTLENGSGDSDKMRSSDTPRHADKIDLVKIG
jgi:hypothetical protein